MESISRSNGSKVYISAAINPQNSMKTNAVELIYISNATTALETFLNGKNANLFHDILVVDSEGSVLLSMRETDVGSNYYETMDMGSALDTVNHPKLEESFQINSSRVSKTSWKIFCLTKIEDVTAEFNEITRNGGILLIVVLCLFSFFSIFYFRSIVFPIKQLIRKMKAVEEGNLDTSIAVRGEDEIYELGSAFNKMVVRINDLIAERNKKEKERSRAEMEALQAQINPHFIANTLSTLRFMAMLAKADNIKEMAEAFLTIVSSSFNRGSRFHSVEAEISVLKSYIFIMKARYGDKYVVKFEVEDSVRSCQLMKMLIQPLVENAIIHGLAGQDCDGSLWIRFKNVENALQIEVEDNGIGIAPDRIDRLLREDQRNKNGFTGLGIKSVDQRIKLNHGDSFGLQIDSQVGQYTRFRIRLPLFFQDPMEEVTER